MKLGKKPATVDERDLSFAKYRLVGGELPKHPSRFGHEALVTRPWGMLGNDTVGDCVFAGAAHETMIWNAEGGRDVAFDDASVLSDYSAVTGYDPSDPSTDQGTDVRAALKYRRKVGIVDAAGVRHQIGAFVSLEPGNWDHLLEAIWLFGAVGIGIRFPDYAMDQFQAGHAWSEQPGGTNEGGHYVPLVSYRRRLACITWGKHQEMTHGFYTAQCDEAFAILSLEMLREGRTLEGFDLAALQADLRAVAA